MEISTQKSLLKMYEEGYTIFIDAGFVDSSVLLEENEEGAIVFYSEVYSGKSLDGIEEEDVTIYQEVPWEYNN